MPDNKKTKIEEDLQYAKLVNSGDEPAREKFMAEFMDWALHIVKERLIKGYCFYPKNPHSFEDYICCLIVLQTPQKFISTGFDRIHCDECMDIYMWVFEYLFKRSGAYEARGGATFKTYIWSILNSRFLAIDWLREKYGRIDEDNRLPVCIEKLGKKEKTIFFHLRHRKTAHWIAEKMQIPLNEAEEKIMYVKNILTREKKLYYIQNLFEGGLNEVTRDGEEIERKELAVNHDPVQTLNLRSLLSKFKKALSELPNHAQRLLMLKYSDGLNSEDILEICSRMPNLIHKKTGKPEQMDVDKALKKGELNLLKLLNSKLRDDKAEEMGLKGLKNLLHGMY